MRYCSDLKIRMFILLFLNQTYVVGTQNDLNEMVLLSFHNIQYLCS